MSDWQHLIFANPEIRDPFEIYREGDRVFTRTTPSGDEASNPSRHFIDHLSANSVAREATKSRFLHLVERGNTATGSAFGETFGALTEDTVTGLYIFDQLENVFGEDDRKPVEDAKIWPFCSVGRLVFDFDKGRATGSGTLISPRHVVTAGHNVSVKKYGGWIKSIVFQPAASKDELPFGTVPAVACFAPPDWIEREDENFDIAILRLAEPVGARAGFMGLASLPDSALTELNVAMTGYPGDKGGTDQFYQLDAVTAVSASRFGYKHDTWKGQSGTSMFAMVGPDPGPRIVGVHTTGNLVTNAATRITQRLLEEITRVVTG